jgi:hypothetical protein
MPEMTLTPKSVRIAEDEAKWLSTAATKGGVTQNDLVRLALHRLRKELGAASRIKPETVLATANASSTSSHPRERQPARRSRPRRSLQVRPGTERRRRRKLPRALAPSVLAPAERFHPGRAASIAPAMRSRQKSASIRDSSPRGVSLRGGLVLVLWQRFVGRGHDLPLSLCGRLAKPRRRLARGSSVARRIASRAVDASHQSALPLRRASQNQLHPLPRRRPRISWRATST